jgi:hypothetical protein
MTDKQPIDAKLKATWTKLLQEIPVSVNNFYGDPMIQWDDTCNKLDNLLTYGHKGPVSIITKGVITEERAVKLKEYCDKGLALIVLVSISELPQFEKIPSQHRYTNLKLLNKHGVPNIAYVRPMVPPYNTSNEIIDKIFKNIDETGCKYVVASGFRGDDNIVGDMSPDDRKKWVLRVKLMTGEIFDRINANSEKLGMHLFTRTSCGVAAVLGLPQYNPYYYSPSLVKCKETNCPLIGVCKPVTKPKEGSLEFLKYLGIEVELAEGDCSLRCGTSSERRLNCPSCCTTCYMLKVPRINVLSEANLGLLTFVRFITGMLASRQGVNDNGDKDIALVKFPNYPSINSVQCLNSWWPYAHIGDKCFDCTYCIERYYKSTRRDFGIVPVKLLEEIC